MERYPRLSWTTRSSVALLLSALILTANAQSPPSNYEQRFINPKDGVHLKDNNVWVYTSAFAKRFGMPAQWIDDTLKGAEAVAYRVEWSSLRECGFFRDPNNCRPIEYCILDVYLTDNQSRKLPWKNNKTKDFVRHSSSTRFLTAQNQNDKKSWDPEKKRSDISRANIGLDSISWVSGPPREGKVYSGSSDGVHVWAYDQEVFPGLDYLQFSVDCNFPTQKSNVRLFFMEKFPDRDDYDVSYEELIEEKKPKVLKFKKIRDDWFHKYETGNVPHVLALPNSYIKRVNAYDRKEYEPKSLATEVEKRMTGEAKKPAESRWWEKLFGGGGVNNYGEQQNFVTVDGRCL